MKKTRRVSFKSVFLWGCVFLLTLVLSMGGAYAYFTATAAKKQASATTGIIRVKVTDTDMKISNGSSSAGLKLVPGNEMRYAGKVVNDGTAPMFAVLECGIYLLNSTTPISVQYYDAKGNKLVYNSSTKQYTSAATQIAVGASADFLISYTVSTALGNEYKNTKATMKIVAHAIQTANLGTSSQSAAVHATNLLLAGTAG